MQPPLNFPCSNCGAHLLIDGSTPMPTCAYCHTQNALPREVWAPFEAARAEAAENARAEAMRAALAKNAAASRKVSAWIFAVPVIFVVLIAVAIVFAVKGSAPADPLASAGDPCNGRTAACSRDKKANLQCGADDKMKITDACKGPNGCQVSADGTSITCDYTLADAKDPCDTTDDACSTDHKSELRCQANHWVVAATCKGPDACTLTPAKKGTGYTLSCDDHIADVGDPCFDSERTACSSDRKAYLTCTAQKFAVDKTCKKGCTVKKLAGTGSVEMDCE